MQHKLPFGITALGVLVVALVGIPSGIDSKFQTWQDNPHSIYLTLYIFNVTNPDEVEAGGKPMFQEAGPYVYRVLREKVNVTYDDPTNQTMQYRERKTYFFDEEKSGSNNRETDLVNVINMPFVNVVHGIRSTTPALLDLVANKFLGTEKLTRRNVKVRELFFEGFDVSLYTNNPVLALMLPEEFSGGRFGLYKGDNASVSKIYNVYTGVNNVDIVGVIKEYDGTSELGFWRPGTECDKVKGTDGYTYPPLILADRKIDVFSTDLCRSIQFDYMEGSEYEGIYGYRFGISNWTLEDPRINPENMCYCMKENLEDCPRAGVISLESCQNGAPIIMSSPYFLDAYEGYLNDSNLPSPVRDLHASYIDIEPNSGQLLRSHRRLQISIDLKLGTGVNAYANLTRDIVFPLIWRDESFEMTPST